MLDAPDIDSVEERNRALAAQLLAAADLWLFVTTAARYADQVPWDFLKQAADRSAAVAIVLDRTPPAAVAEVSSHLARMLTARGLRDSPLFAVREGNVDNDGLLPASDVAEIKEWLGALAADADARSASSSRPSRAPSARSPPSPTGRRRRDGAGRHAGAAAAQTSTRPTTTRSARSTRPRPTAPCCAARCWPAGRSSSAPAS